MNESKRNNELNNGWILCPSKSFPGKFYYFNVLNGETAWSLNQAENKELKKENTFHKIADKSHGYPEPTTLPDETTITSHNIFSNTKKTDFLQNTPLTNTNTNQLPIFGQATFPKYVATVEPLIPNIVWTSVPFPMFCPDIRKPMFDKVTQISEYERELFAQSSKIPLSKRFSNYEKPFLRFDRRNKIIKPLKFETSTPKNSFLECVSEPQSFVSKPVIKDPVFKVEPKLPTPKIPDITKSNEKPVLSLSGKVESTKCSTGVQVEKESALEKLDSTDLRFLLLAKRKSFGADDTEVERKKPKASDLKTPTPKKKVTFNLKDETEDDDSKNDEALDDFIPLTPNPTWTTIDATKSPLVLKDKIPPSFINETYEIPSTVKSQIPTFQSTPNNELPTFQPSCTRQLPTFQPNATKQLPTFQPTTTRQLATFQSTVTNQTTLQPTASNEPTLRPIATNQQPTVKSTTWYVVVDTDVLLLDYELIEKLVMSDPKCRLVIPHVVASDIEALCLGDCRGQQRVINARQLTRKLAAPPPYYIVEPRNTENGNLVTDSILHCCMKAANKNYYVVLITNDPHLQIRATLLNIPSYKLNEIKYGVDISRHTATQQKNTKDTNTSRNITKDMTNMFDQNISLFSNFKITSETKPDEKNFKMNDSNVKNQCNINYRSPRKQLFLSSESETDASLDSDNLVSKTKPKCKENIENGSKSDSDGTSEISSVVSSLKLKDKHILKPQNVGRNLTTPPNVGRDPFPQENVGKNPFLIQNGFGSFEKHIVDPKAVFNKYSCATIPIESPMNQTKEDLNHFQNDFLDYNFENQEKLFSSIPITNMKLNVPKSRLNKSVMPPTLSLQEPYVVRENKLLNPSQIRIEKLMNSINSDSHVENHNTKPKDTAPVFKIPKLLPIKGTRNRTVRVERSPVNDRVATRLNKDTIDQSVRKFRIKNKYMRAKVNTRIDEWICSYMQIMEDVLVNILQKNSVCMENTVAPLTFKDTLNCVKMLYDSHTKVRDVINRLSELLDKCMIGVQGQFKTPVAPEDFMRIFGYGVLLVQALKNILPLNEDLKEAKIRLNALHMNLQSNYKEVDPELVKSPSVSRFDKDEEEIRPQFFKKTSYVIEYLKKHFKEWEAYNDVDEQNHQIENHTDFKVVRTLGKNLNLLKIDKKKNMSLSNITKENDYLDMKHGPKIIRLLENNQLIKPNDTENIETNETKLMRLSNKEMNRNEFDFRSEENLNREKDLALSKTTENLEQDRNLKSKDEEFNYTSHENTFLGTKTEKDEPKIIRKIEFIDEFEDKLKTKEPLDLDLLDYSDIYEPSIDKNIDFDVISEKNDKHEKKDIFEIGLNYGLETPTFTLEDFYITPTISPESVKNDNKTIYPKTTENSDTVKENKSTENVTDSYLCSVSVNNNVTNSKIEEKSHKIDSEAESDTYTEKGSNNDSCIGNDNSEKHFNNSEKHFDNSDKHFVNSETPNYDSGTHLDNSESHNDNFGKTSQIVLDDNTNDSGFENDSTYAHTVVKVFLKEICTTFQVIHAFVNKFVEEIRETELSDKRKDTVHNLASKALEDMVAIINHLKLIIKRESAEDTVLKTLLRNAGVEATTDRRMMRYRQIVIKCLEQALILESALKIIVSTTIGDFDAISNNAETINSNVRYFNIFEPDYQPFIEARKSLDMKWMIPHPRIDLDKCCLTSKMDPCYLFLISDVIVIMDYLKIRTENDRQAY